jgi:hypothetical protein
MLQGELNSREMIGNWHEGTQIAKQFDVDGVLRWFDGELYDYGSVVDLYCIIYKDGDSEELISTNSSIGSKVNTERERPFSPKISGVAEPCNNFPNFNTSTSSITRRCVSYAYTTGLTRHDARAVILKQLATAISSNS